MSFITSFESHVFIASGDLIRFFRLGQNSQETQTKPLWSWENISPERIQKPTDDDEKSLKSVEKRIILCIAHSNVIPGSNRRLLAVGTNEKQIHVLEYFCDPTSGEIAKIEHIISAVVPKAPTALAFDREDAFVAVGDRAGDVYKFSVLDGKAVELAGAVSMILDVAFTPDGKRLVICDRDEKVRVMRYPTTFVVDAFCLGHTEYVRTLAVENDENTWSAGGDKKVHNWPILESSHPTRTVDLSTYEKAIRKIAICKSLNKMVVILEKSDQLVFVDLQQEPIAHSIMSFGQEQFLDVTVAGEQFVVLGKSTALILNAADTTCSYVKMDEELAASLEATEDAIDNFYKNVTHNNQAEYEKRKAEKFDAIEKKKRRLNED